MESRVALTFFRKWNRANGTTLVLIIITVPLTVILACLRLYKLLVPSKAAVVKVPLAAFTVSLCAFCFCRSSGNHRFFAASGVERVQHNQGQLRFLL